jgi:hypothetical protein
MFLSRLRLLGLFAFTGGTDMLQQQAEERDRLVRTPPSLSDKPTTPLKT